MEHTHVVRHTVLTYSRPWWRGFTRVWWLRCVACPQEVVWGPFDSRAQAAAVRTEDFTRWLEEMERETGQLLAKRARGSRGRSAVRGR